MTGVLNSRSARLIYGGRGRYAENWLETFAMQYQPFLREGMTILDFGSGRRPVIPLSERPSKCRYIGLDISAAELALAPAGSYDEEYARDITNHDSALDGQIDLAVSWQVLEHVKPLSNAIDNIYSYLRADGHLVAMLSGRNAHFAVINRVVPETIGVLAMQHLLRRTPDSVFHAHYDACTYSELSRLLEAWRDVTIQPHYRGASYFNFSRSLTTIYLAFEDWLARSNKKQLATHYVISAMK